MTAAAEILVVDDERVLRQGLARELVREGYAVREAADGEKALAAIAEHRPDLILLDVDMPRRGGIATCEEIRRRDPLLPVIFLTAYDSDVDQVRGYGVGADGYFSKTVARAVVFAAIRAALSRRSAVDEAVQAPRRAALGRLTVDFDRLVIEGPEERTPLTKTEADILWLLLSERGKVFTYDEIFDIVRGADFAGDVHILQVHVQRLREKLGPAADLLATRRGIGYQLLK